MATDAKVTLPDVVDERNIFPSVGTKNAFCRSVHVALADFLKNAYEYALASILEEERRDIDVKLVESAVAKLLQLKDDPKDSAALRQRAELISIIIPLVDRNRAIKERTVTKNLATQAVIRLFDSLTTVSGDAVQEKSRQKSILDALASVSILDWQMSIMALAIRRSKFTNSQVPLEFKASFVRSDKGEQPSKRYSYGGTKVCLYDFAMEVIREWITASKESCNALSGKRLAENPLYVEMCVQLFGRGNSMQIGIKMAVNKILANYAQQYVGEAPNGVAVVADKEKRWLLKAGRTRDRAATASSKRQLSEEAALALQYGLPASSLIQMAAEEGFYYGANRQINMFRVHETRLKDKAMEVACAKMAQKMVKESEALQSNLLTEFGRMVTSVSSSRPSAPSVDPRIPITPITPAAPSEEHYTNRMQHGSNHATPHAHAMTPSAPGYRHPSAFETPSMPSATHQPPNNTSHLPAYQEPWKSNGPTQDQTGYAQTPTKRVSFATSYLNPKNTGGYSTPPPVNHSLTMSGNKRHNVSPMTQNLSHRKPLPVYEDSSAEETSSSGSTMDSSDDLSGSTDSSFESD